jgi:hypothetical protein
LRALRYHLVVAERRRLRSALQAQLLMQGRMKSMQDEVLASEELKQSKEKQS